MSERGTESADQLPKRTEPIWEVEPLISGVAVFAMLQLPGWLEDRLMFLLPRFGEGWRDSLIMVFSYAMGAAVILAERILLIGIAIVLAPALLMSLLDRRWGARLRERNPLRSRVAPLIQSAEIDGHYIRLTVPYQPARDAAAMQQRCPKTAAIEDAEARAGAMLRCLAALHPVTLDGIFLVHLRYDAGSDARTDRPALVAMIDVRSLAQGRHEPAIASSLPASGDMASAAPWIIPFWR